MLNSIYKSILCKHKSAGFIETGSFVSEILPAQAFCFHYEVSRVKPDAFFGHRKEAGSNIVEAGGSNPPPQPCREDVTDFTLHPLLLFFSIWYKD